MRLLLFALCLLLAGCQQRLEVEPSPELERLLALRTTVAMTDADPLEVLSAGFDHAGAGVTNFMADGDDRLVTVDVRDATIEELLRILYRDRLDDVAFSLHGTCFEINGSRSAREASQRAYEQQMRQEEAARRNIASAVERCDAIEISRLEPKVTVPLGKGFPIPSYGDARAVVRVVIVDRSGLKPMRATLGEFLRADDSGFQMMCHEPGFGVRCWRSGALVLEASFCWSCNNYDLVLAGQPRFVGMNDGPVNARLKALLIATAGGEPEATPPP
jgi:hypothetical protein